MDGGRLDVAPAGAHLDTVRSLHQTVVSLRTALEVSKNELKELKEKYQQHSQCIEYADVIEKLTVENHILRRKLIDSEIIDDKDTNKLVKFRVTYSPHTAIEDVFNSNIDIQSATDKDGIETLQPNPDETEVNNNNLCDTEKLNDIEEEILESLKQSVTENSVSTKEENIQIEDSQSQITSCYLNGTNHSGFNTKLELLSKFDVKIKVRTLKEGATFSSTTSETESSVEEKKTFEKGKAKFHFKEKKEHFENLEDPKGHKINFRTISSENIKMALPNESEIKNKVDKFDVQVRITSEENLVVKETNERSRRKDTLNLDVDNLSLRSMSEGDNSVFSEGGITPVDPNAAVTNEEKQEQENVSGNESEEVDDIELIFTTDESKDMSNLQEDLVSIRETESWAPLSASTTHSTPVLVKFHTLDPDFQPGDRSDDTLRKHQGNSSFQRVISESSLRAKRVSLPNDKDIRNAAFSSKRSLDLPSTGILKSYDNKSENMLYRKSPNISTRKLDSVDSLTADYKGLSFDNTKSSSYELGSSMDILHRDESVDSFRTAHLGHRFSIFAENDISKCGISEDDLTNNLNIRRNTCPNPFQYRPPPYRGTARTSGPLKAPATSSRLRAALRGGYSRRESGAQTDMSALPPRWGSDGYLAYQSAAASVAVPGRATAAECAARPAPRAAPHELHESRRLLLSDIGFTSMVPELSRSADPLYALGRRPQTAQDVEATNTAKYMSRGTFRSPTQSVDRSSEWTPQTIYVPTKDVYREWRSSLPDVRRDDTEELLAEADAFLRRSTHDLHTAEYEPCDTSMLPTRPYVPAEARQLRLGHTVKLLAPHGRVAVGRVRYVGLCGSTAATAGVMVGAEVPRGQLPPLPHNDGTLGGRRYFLAAPTHQALFVPFSKVVMAWAN